MKADKKKKLQAAGWSVGSTAEFLELSEAEATIVDMKLALAEKLKELRRARRLTQLELAKRIGSSQSRVAKMEIADSSVSIELLVKSLVSLGASQVEIGEMIRSRGAERAETPFPKRKKRQTVPS